MAGGGWSWLADGAAAALLALLAWTDWRWRRLPRLPMGAFLVAGAGAALLHGGLPAGCASAAAAGLPVWLLRQAIGRRWVLGGGDLRLAAGLGLWLGAPVALAVMTGGAALSVVWGLGLRLLGREDRAPFGTACALVTLPLLLFFGT